LLSALKLVISIPDHSLSAKYREWSGIINLEVVTGVETGIDTEMVKDRENMESIWQYKKCIYSH
jgi:hypothetical protein